MVKNNKKSNIRKLKAVKEKDCDTSERRNENDLRRIKNNKELAKNYNKRTNKSTGRRKVDNQAAYIHTITLSVVLTLLILQGVAVALHYFIPAIFE